jgi:hypothetical protein
MRRARHNPDATTWLAVGLGLALVGGAVYFMTRPATPAATTTPNTAGTLNAAQTAQAQATAAQLATALPFH